MCFATLTHQRCRLGVLVDADSDADVADRALADADSDADAGRLI